MNEKLYKVVLEGCDDDTTIVIALDNQQVNTLETLALMVNDKSESNCQPRLFIHRTHPDDDNR